MARVIWTPEAIQNLNRIFEYLLASGVSWEHANSLLDGLLDAMEAPQRFPRMGRMIPEYQREELREVIRDGYRIAYEIDGETLWVHSVTHGSADVARRMREMFQDD